MPNAEKVEKVAALKEQIEGSSALLLTGHFKHEDEGASPKMAKRLRAMLEDPTRGLASV